MQCVEMSLRACDQSVCFLVDYSHDEWKEVQTDSSKGLWCPWCRQLNRDCYIYTPPPPLASFLRGDRHSRRMHASLYPAGQRVHVRETPLCVILQAFRFILEQSCGYRHSVAGRMKILQTNLRTGPLPCALNPLGTFPDPYRVCTSYPIKPSP